MAKTFTPDARKKCSFIASLKSGRIWFITQLLLFPSFLLLLLYYGLLFIHIVLETEKPPAAQSLYKIKLLFGIVSELPEQFYMLQFIINGIPIMLLLFFLLLGEYYFLNKWRKGELPICEARIADLEVRVICFFIHLFSFFNFFAAAFSTTFSSNRICMGNALLLSILLFFSSRLCLHRENFRIWPNYIVAFSNTILYLSLLDIPSSDGRMWNLINLGSKVAIIDMFQAIPVALTGGILATTFVVILKEPFANLFSSVISLHPENLPQSRRRIRHRLLSHWHYNNASLLSQKNSNAAIALCEGLIFAAGITYSLNKSPSELSLHTYTILLGAMFCTIGLMLLWDISDSQLIHSEYRYLSFRGLDLRSKDVESSTTHWLDYCQVLTNLYTNVSGLDSEDAGYHSLSEMLERLQSYLTRDKCCCGFKFFSDILMTKSDVNAILLRESNHMPPNEQGAYEPMQNASQMAKDIQFSDLMDLASGNSDQQTAQTVFSGSPLDFFNFLANCAFEGRQQVWAQRLIRHSISGEEIVQLIKKDVMINILCKDSSEFCGLLWLGCPYKADDSQCSGHSAGEQDSFVQRRMELMLLFPFLVSQCFARRWHTESKNILFVGDFFHFYKEVSTKKLKYSEACSKKLDDAVYSAFRYLLEAHLDLSCLALIMECFENEFLPGSEEYPKVRQASVYAITKDLPPQFSRLVAFSGKESDTRSSFQRDLLQSAKYLFFVAHILFMNGG